MSKPHILAVPYPAQGHVIPLMELALCIAKHGFNITFVNTESIHERVMNAFTVEDNVDELINLVSIPDGMEPWEDRSDLGKLSEAIVQHMPRKLEELIAQNNGMGDNEITCIIADENMGWALEVADKMGIKRAAFWPASAATLAWIFKIPELIKNKVIDHDGTILKSEMTSLCPSLPEMSTSQFAWASIFNEKTERIVFKIIQANNKAVKLADKLICNTSLELEPEALALFPEIIPIGPVLASNRLGKAVGHFWPEDTTCMAWLDQHPAQSVIYIAFGSFTIFDQKQLQELALGLELTNKPFLWVVRPDMIDKAAEEYLKGFKDRIDSNRGRVVSWAPQQEVLDHPSVACFLSHCGWNSTLEGISNGVPFLCWPYFADQFLDQNYICDVWKIGLGFGKDESGIITKEEIKNKVEQLLDDDTFRTRAMELKDKAISSVYKGGSSDKNMKSFIDWIK